MIKVTLNVDENEVIRGVSLWGHASNYTMEECQSICFAVSSVIYTIDKIDHDHVLEFESGKFTYTPSINTLHPNTSDEHYFTLLEVLVTHIFVLSQRYPKCFIIERRKQHYED